MRYHLGMQALHTLVGLVQSVPTNKILLLRSRVPTNTKYYYSRESRSSTSTREVCVRRLRT
jgi:hypothetical protein